MKGRANSSDAKFLSFTQEPAKRKAKSANKTSNQTMEKSVSKKDLGLSTIIEKKVHEIVSFSKKDNGEFEYYGELKGRKKCFTRKAIVASTPLFAEVIKFYEKKFATFFDCDREETTA